MPARCSVASDLHLLSLSISFSLRFTLHNVRVTRIVRSFFFARTRVSLVRGGGVERNYT